MAATSHVHEKVLLVEGDDDLRVIIELMKCNGIRWGNDESEWPVRIRALGSVSEITKAGSIKTELMVSHVRVLGIVVDADQSAENRWRSIHGRIRKLFPNAPKSLPSNGVVLANEEGKKFGVWILPDNQSPGMMEDFLTKISPSFESTLWNHVVKSTEAARSHGATFKDAHLSKACLHTLLAWTHPPGRQLHQAITKRILKPSAEQAAPFVNWFRRLYELEEN